MKLALFAPPLVLVALAAAGCSKTASNGNPGPSSAQGAPASAAAVTAPERRFTYTHDMAQVPFVEAVTSIRRVEDLLDRLGDVRTEPWVDKVTGAKTIRLEYPLLAHQFAQVHFAEQDFRHGGVSLAARVTFTERETDSGDGAWLSELLASQREEREAWRKEQERLRVEAEVTRVTREAENREYARLERIARLEAEREEARAELESNAERRRDALSRRFSDRATALAAQAREARSALENFEQFETEERERDAKDLTLRRESELESIETITAGRLADAEMRIQDPKALAAEKARIAKDRENDVQEWKDFEAGLWKAFEENHLKGIAIYREPLDEAEAAIKALPAEQRAETEALDDSIRTERTELEERFRRLLEAEER